MRYMTSGVCSQAIEVEVENNIVTKVKFIGGCPGNTLRVARLIEGMNVLEAIEKTKGIRCGMKATSCPDQLSKALEAAIANQ